MRPSSALGADGGLNLLNGARVAGSPDARGMGVMVVLNDEINAARDVAKTSNYRVQTFVTRDFGVLGYADADKVVFYRRPLRRTAPETEFDVAGYTDLPRVDIIPAMPALTRRWSQPRWRPVRKASFPRAFRRARHHPRKRRP